MGNRFDLLRQIVYTSNQKLFACIALEIKYMEICAFSFFHCEFDVLACACAPSMSIQFIDDLYLLMVPNVDLLNSFYLLLLLQFSTYGS